MLSAVEASTCIGLRVVPIIPWHPAYGYASATPEQIAVDVQASDSVSNAEIQDAATKRGTTPEELAEYESSTREQDPAKRNPSLQIQARFITLQAKLKGCPLLCEYIDVLDLSRDKLLLVTEEHPLTLASTRVRQCIARSALKLGVSETLQTRAKSSVNPWLRNIATIARDTLRALFFLHKAGFAHRDLGLSNIAIPKRHFEIDQGSDSVLIHGCKISEAGNFFLLGEGSLVPFTILGDIYAASPESLTHVAQFGARVMNPGTAHASDIWSLGALLARLGHELVSELKAVTGAPEAERNTAARSKLDRRFVAISFLTQALLFADKHSQACLTDAERAALACLTENAQDLKAAIKGSVSGKAVAATSESRKLTRTAERKITKRRKKAKSSSSQPPTVQLEQSSSKALVVEAPPALEPQLSTGLSDTEAESQAVESDTTATNRPSEHESESEWEEYEEIELVEEEYTEEGPSDPVGLLPDSAQHVVDESSEALTANSIGVLAQLLQQIDSLGPVEAQQALSTVLQKSLGVNTELSLDECLNTLMAWLNLAGARADASGPHEDSDESDLSSGGAAIFGETTKHMTKSNRWQSMVLFPAAVETSSVTEWYNSQALVNELKTSLATYFSMFGASETTDAQDRHWDLFASFLSACLTPNPRSRASAADMLSHPFLKLCAPESQSAAVVSARYSQLNPSPPGPASKRIMGIPNAPYPPASLSLHSTSAQPPRGTPISAAKGYLPLVTIVEANSKHADKGLVWNTLHDSLSDQPQLLHAYEPGSQSGESFKSSFLAKATWDLSELFSLHIRLLETDNLYATQFATDLASTIRREAMSASKDKSKDGQERKAYLAQVYASLVQQASSSTSAVALSLDHKRISHFAGNESSASFDSLLAFLRAQEGAEFSQVLKDPAQSTKPLPAILTALANECGDVVLPTVLGQPAFASFANQDARVRSSIRGLYPADLPAMSYVPATRRSHLIIVSLRSLVHSIKRCIDEFTSRPAASLRELVQDLALLDGMTQSLVAGRVYGRHLSPTQLAAVEIVSGMALNAECEAIEKILAAVALPDANEFISAAGGKGRIKLEQTSDAQVTPDEDVTSYERIPPLVSEYVRAKMAMAYLVSRAATETTAKALLVRLCNRLYSPASSTSNYQTNLFASIQDYVSKTLLLHERWQAKDSTPHLPLYLQAPPRQPALSSLTDVVRSQTWAILLGVKSNYREIFEASVRPFIERSRDTFTQKDQIEKDLARCHQYHPLPNSAYGTSFLRDLLQAVVMALGNPSLCIIPIDEEPVQMLSPGQTLRSYTAVEDTADSVLGQSLRQVLDSADVEIAERLSRSSSLPLPLAYSHFSWGSADGLATLMSSPAKIMFPRALNTRVESTHGAMVRRKPAPFVYWQGLESVCAVVAATYPNDLPLAFAVTVGIIKRFLAPFYTSNTQIPLARLALLLNQLLSFHDPKLAIHLHRLGLNHDMYGLAWHMTMFSHALSIPKAQLLWDDVLGNSPEYMVFYSLAVLISLRLPLLAASDVPAAALVLTKGFGGLSVRQTLIIARHLLAGTPPIICARASPWFTATLDILASASAPGETADATENAILNPFAMATALVRRIGLTVAQVTPQELVGIFASERIHRLRTAAKLLLYEIASKHQSAPSKEGIPSDQSQEESETSCESAQSDADAATTWTTSAKDLLALTKSTTLRDAIRLVAEMIHSADAELKLYRYPSSALVVDAFHESVASSNDASVAVKFTSAWDRVFGLKQASHTGEDGLFVGVPLGPQGEQVSAEEDSELIVSAVLGRLSQRRTTLAAAIGTDASLASRNYAYHENKVEHYVGGDALDIVPLSTERATADAAMLLSTHSQALKSVMAGAEDTLRHIEQESLSKEERETTSLTLSRAPSTASAVATFSTTRRSSVMYGSQVSEDDVTNSASLALTLSGISLASRSIEPFYASVSYPTIYISVVDRKTAFLAARKLLARGLPRIVVVVQDESFTATSAAALLASSQVDPQTGKPSTTGIQTLNSAAVEEILKELVVESPESILPRNTLDTGLIPHYRLGYDIDVATFVANRIAADPTDSGECDLSLRAALTQSSETAAILAAAKATSSMVKKVSVDLLEPGLAERVGELPQVAQPTSPQKTATTTGAQSTSTVGSVIRSALSLVGQGTTSATGSAAPSSSSAQAAKAIQTIQTETQVIRGGTSTESANSTASTRRTTEGDIGGKGEESEAKPQQQDLATTEPSKQFIAVIGHHKAPTGEGAATARTRERLMNPSPVTAYTETYHVINGASGIWEFAVNREWRYSGFGQPSPLVWGKRTTDSSRQILVDLDISAQLSLRNAAKNNIRRSIGELVEMMMQEGLIKVKTHPKNGMTQVYFACYYSAEGQQSSTTSK